MPGDTTPPLRDYQETGVAWVLRQMKRYKAVLLADDAGLGKTRQALLVALRRNAERVLIVCPAGARRVWQSEIKRWLPGWSSRVVLVEPGTKHTDATKARLVTPLILIIGYDELSNLKSHWAAQLGRRRWDLMVLDEAHYLKNPSNRTLALYGLKGATEGIQASAEKVLLLTGTPTPNHAGELWQHIRTFWPGAMKYQGRALTQAEFEDRYTRYRDTIYGRQVTGSKNQATLRRCLEPVVLRRRKSQVLKELPPLQLQDIPLAEPRRWQESLSFEARTAAAKLGLGRDDDTLLRGLRSEGSVATLRREIGELKVQPTILWVQERMLSTNKLLIFAWHHSVIAHLYRGLLEFDPVVVTGETAPKLRAQAIEHFQTHAQTRIFIGQVLAAGTAVTLTAASEVAICEPSWVPGENHQAICRAHRLGQRDNVLASFLYLPGTLDERIMGVFRRKAAEISELEGDEQYASGNQLHVRPGDRRRAV